MMARRCGWVLVAATSCASIGPAPAAAATRVVAYAPSAAVGPVLSGDSVVWGEERAPFGKTGRFRLRAAAPAGTIGTLLTAPDRTGARPRWTRLLGGAGGLAFAYEVVRDSRDPTREPAVRSTVNVALTGAGVRRTVTGTPLQLSGTTLLVDRSGEVSTKLSLTDIAGAAPDGDLTLAGLDPDAYPGFDDARIAGDFLAVAQDVPTEELNPDTVMSLFRLSTGARIYSRRTEPAVWTIADLAPDGRLLVAEQIGGVAAGSRRRLHYLDPSPAPSLHLVAPLVSSGRAVIVGDEAIAPGPAGGRGAQPIAFPLAGGPPRPLGTPATAIADLAATANTVAWRTDDGCVLRAPVAAPADSALPPGACPRAALTFPPEQGLRADRGRVLRIRVGCPGAPPPGCVGTVVLRLVASRSGKAVSLATSRVAVAPNTTRSVALRLSHPKTRIAARRGGDAELRATIADPAGRKRTTSLDFFLEVPGTPPVPPLRLARPPLFP